MRTLPPSLAFALALGLLGCRADAGSRASSNMAESPTPASAERSTPSRTAESVPSTDQRPLLVCFGDSLTAGFGASDGASYPDFLQADLDRAGYHYRVVNEGVSGDTTKDGLDRLDEILALKPAAVVLEFGGNDGLRGLKVESTRQNLATMIQALQSAGIRVMLAGITLPPDYGPDYVGHFTAMYPALARQFHVPVLPFLLDHVYGVPGMMQADRTHATNAGNRIVAQNVLPLVEPLLKK